MASAPLRDNEAARLAALRRLQVLDTPPEPEFDALARAASLACGMPVALVSLVDAQRQWFKANIGLEGLCEIPREAALCAHTILGDGVLEVPDARGDVRFAGNPLVTGCPHIRFYAGAPVLADGLPVGTLCLLDHRPGRLDPARRAILASLAEAAGAALEGRRAAQMLAASEARFRSLAEGAPHGVFLADGDGACSYANARWQAVFDADGPFMPGAGWFGRLLSPGREAVRDEWRRCVIEGVQFECEARILSAANRIKTVLLRARPSRAADGRLLDMVGTIEDISERRAQQERLRKSELLLERTGQLAAVGGWEVELAEGSIYWPEQTCRLMAMPPGYRPTMEEAIHFYAPEARPVIRAALQAAIEHGTGWDLELPLRRADGEQLWVHTVGSAEVVKGKPVRLVGAFQDVTERHHERESLLRARERLRVQPAPPAAQSSRAQLP